MNKATLVLTAALLTATPAFSLAQPQASQKDECLLMSKDCAQQVDDIYSRMQKLDREIKKGTRVYSPKELKKLQQKLAETQQQLDDLEKPGH